MSLPPTPNLKLVGRGGAGALRLSSRVQGNAGHTWQPATRRCTGAGRLRASGSMFIGRMAAGPHSAQTAMVWEGGSRYGHTEMPVRIPRRRGKHRAQSALRGGVLLADRLARVGRVVCRADCRLQCRLFVQGLRVRSGAGGRGCSWLDGRRATCLTRASAAMSCVSVLPEIVMSFEFAFESCGYKSILNGQRRGCGRSCGTGWGGADGAGGLPRGHWRTPR